MGLTLELAPVAPTRFTGADGTSKEGDSALKPFPARQGGTSWPTVVIEAGWSESLNCLRIDAIWWLEESRGEVKIVIIISILSGGNKCHLETWELNKQRSARSFQEIDVDLDSREVTGSPLILEFEKIFLRQCGRHESDVVITEQDLLGWADYVKALSM